MQKILIYIILLILVFDPDIILGQAISNSDTLKNHQLDEVVIDAPRLNEFLKGSKVIEFDSALLKANSHKNLSDLLSEQGNMFVKSYGSGSLATTSFRGGSAGHTSVLWNGIPISSPMSGQLDLSLIPVEAVDIMKIQYGAGSSLFGSGAIGGVIHLLSFPTFNNGFTYDAGIGVGSYSNFQESLSIEISKKKWVSSFKIFNKSAKNNFKYTNIYSPVHSQIIQPNSALKTYGSISENKFLLAKNQVLSFNAWVQHTEREIPPTMLEQQSKSIQKDDIWRLNSEWNIHSEKISAYVRTAYLFDKLFYSDSISRIYSTSATHQWLTEAESKFFANKNHLFNIGIHNLYASANNENYINTQKQNQFALFTSYQFISNNKRFTLDLSARKEMIKDLDIPLTYSIVANYKFKGWGRVHASFAKVFRIPTFNDLYWSPGGNPDLIPESGYNKEFGMNIELKDKGFIYRNEMTVFSRNISNWIVWMPGLSFWSPKNILSVWSRGMETSNSLAYNYRKTKYTIYILTNYVRSTNQKSQMPNDRSIGRQLIYVPMYSGMVKFSVQYKALSCYYRHNYTGYRYTSTDNTQFLSPFDLGSFYIAYNWKPKAYRMSFFLEANNVWNEKYQGIQNRAMPEMNFNTGISIQFNHNKISNDK
jgi:iron complex outermembrane receptor protein